MADAGAHATWRLQLAQLLAPLHLLVRGAGASASSTLTGAAASGWCGHLSWCCSSSGACGLGRQGRLCWGRRSWGWHRRSIRGSGICGGRLRIRWSSCRRCSIWSRHRRCAQAIGRCCSLRSEQWCSEGRHARRALWACCGQMIQRCCSCGARLRMRPQALGHNAHPHLLWPCASLLKGWSVSGKHRSQGTKADAL